MKEKRFCPFRRVCTTVRRETKMNQYSDRYSVCLGAKCMAYDDETGECLKLSAAKRSESHLRDTAIPWMYDEGKYKCPMCRSVSEKETNYCQNCGQRLELEARPDGRK